MIKYNNKELPQEACQLITSRVNASNQQLVKNGSQVCKIPDLGATGGNALYRQTAFRSPQQRHRLRSDIQMFPQRRSNSHKIKYQKPQHSKLRKDILRRRQSKSSKLQLLIILPSNAENNQVADSTVDSTAFSPDRTLFNNHRMPCNLMHGQYRASVREDIALGKMKLLTHKSKLTPITEPKEGTEPIESAHRSEEKLRMNLGEKLQMHQNRFIEEKQRELRDFLRYEKGQSPEPGDLARLTGGLNPSSIMNIQSIVPNFTIGQRTSIELKNKERRRTTEPNIETSQEFYQVQDSGSAQNLYDNSKDCSNNPSDNNLYRSKQKMKHYADKFKASKWKKKVILSNLTKFNVPFETYHYRDMLWKLNYSNRLFVEPPLQYQHRLKVYVGKGNNSSMVRALISRRYWFAVTERVEEANFIWTQLKELKYFKTQKPNIRDGREKIKTGNYAGGSLYLLQDMKQFKKYWQRNRIIQEHTDERLLPRLKNFSYKTVIRGESIKQNRLHNHFINNYVISNKKSLFRLLNAYYRQQGLDPFQFIPITYHVCKGLEDPVFLSFQRHYHQLAKQIRRGESNRRNYWIMKPGQNSNRGYGIKLCPKLSDIKGVIKQRATWNDGSQRTHIIQSYIQRPFLYYKRKFDLRHYMLMTCINGQLKGYWYLQGYVRTTSSEYSLDVSASSVHLTNDAIQKYLPGYGKYEKGNKISYAELDAYIRKRMPNFGFYSVVYPQMKRIAMDIMKASANYLDPENLANNFELFGLDFMIDEKLKVWLIEVNSNPCLQLSCPLLSSIIPNLIQNVLELTMDALFPPAVRYCAKIPRYLGHIQSLNKFQLIFDQRIEQIKQYESPVLDIKLLQEQQQQFQDNEQEWEDNL